MEEITTILRQSNEVLGTIDLNIANNFVNIASGIQNDITFFQNDNTDKIMKDSFWIGLYPGMTIEKIEYMIKTIKQFINQQEK